MHQGNSHKNRKAHYGRILSGNLVMSCLIVFGLNVLFYQSDVINNNQSENHTIENENKDNDQYQNEIVEESTLISGLNTIRVLLKTTDFVSYYHDNVEIFSETGMKITIGDKVWNKEGSYDFLINEWSFGEEDTIQIEPLTEGGNHGLTIRSITRAQGNPTYQGSITISRFEDQFYIVNEVPLETYLYSVVPSEMPSSYSKHALMAQAVCARTYAYIYLMEPGLPDFNTNVDDSVSYQVYNNIEKNDKTSEAVDMTLGQILLFDGMPANTFFYSTSCGVSADETVWNTDQESRYPYLTVMQISRQSLLGEGDSDEEIVDYSIESAFQDMIQNVNEADYDYGRPYYRWNCTLDGTETEEILERLKRKYLEDSDTVCKLDAEGETLQEAPDELGELKSIEITQRDESGSVSVVTIIGSKASYQVKTCNTIRYCLLIPNMDILLYDGNIINNLSMLPSSFFIVTKEVNNGKLVSYKIIGGGFGHGVGMSQNAAGKMADEGMNYSDILTFFYKGTSLGEVYNADNTIN